MVAMQVQQKVLPLAFLAAVHNVVLERNWGMVVIIYVLETGAIYVPIVIVIQ